MNRREFLKRAAAGTALLALNAGCGGALTSRKKLLVVAFDGLDPELVDKYCSMGLMPNTSKLRAMGSMRRLATSNPPQSPVAWSGFTTGAGTSTPAIDSASQGDPKSWPRPSLKV